MDHLVLHHKARSDGRHRGHLVRVRVRVRVKVRVRARVRARG